MKMAPRPAVPNQVVETHHFEELSWTLLPNHRFKAILVYVGGLD